MHWPYAGDSQSGHAVLTSDNVGACVTELLTQASRQILLEMTWLLFARIGHLPQNPISPNTAHNLAHSPRLQVSQDSSSASGVSCTTGALPDQFCDACQARVGGTMTASPRQCVRASGPRSLAWLGLYVGLLQCSGPGSLVCK